MENNINSKNYDFLFVDASIPGAKLLQAKSLLFYQNIPAPLGHEKMITPGDMAKFWFSKNTQHQACFVIGDKQIASHILGHEGFVDDIEKADCILALEDADIALVRRAIDRQLPLYYVADSIVENTEKRSYLAKEYIKLGGNAMFLGKPWPFVYEYLASKYPGKKILAIENTMPGLIGAQINKIDSVFIGDPTSEMRKYATYCLQDIADLLKHT